jgi:hypothetical protein
MFIGREIELTALERLYAAGGFAFAALYGRRRIGKTALLCEFSGKKPVIHFNALESNEPQNLSLLLNMLKQRGVVPDETPSSMEEMLDFLFRYSTEQHFVLILDDYHLLTKACKGLPALLVRLIERYRSQSQMMLILSTCSMPVAEKEFFGKKAPYATLLNTSLHLKPLDFFTCRKFFRSISSIELAYIYGMVGGIPEYLCMFHERLSLEDNVRNTFLNPSSILFQEPFLILKQEVREPSLYNAILSAIANGATKLSEIAVVIGEETSVAAAYLRNLILMEIVSKETPATENTAKKTIYRISDSVFRFWYRFLPDVLSDIQQTRPDLAWRKIEPLLTEYMGEVFEEICRQYLSGLSKAGKTPFPLNSIGRWWGMDPFTREKLQVPILAADEHDSMLFGTCKWSPEKMDVEELSHLIEQSEFFPCQQRYFYLFSKSGFTRTCQDTAEQLSNVTLVSFSK